MDLVGGSDKTRLLGVIRAGGVLLEIADDADEATRSRARQLGITIREPLVEPDGRALDEIASLLSKGTLRVTIDEVFPLEAAADAHRRLERGGVRGKLVLAVR
jgi:NADPH:quinone reductase-like Zn-dependent oxidoreductase